MLHTRDPPQDKRFTWVENEMMRKKNIPSKWTQKESLGSNTSISQNSLQKKSHKKGQRRSLHNT